MNIDIDMIECESCGTRLTFKTAASLIPSEGTVIFLYY